MCHTFVRTSSGRLIDANRAGCLMDKHLFYVSEVRIHAQLFEHREYGIEPMPGVLTDPAQAIYDMYTSLHLQEYGRPFLPDIDPDWN